MPIGEHYVRGDICELLIAGLLPAILCVGVLEWVYT